MNHRAEKIPRTEMTPCELLGLLNRLRKHLRETEGLPARGDLTAETSIDDCWDEFGVDDPFEAMNWVFGTRLSPTAWRDQFNVLPDRTLGSLCTLIAADVRPESGQPRQIAENESHEADIFRAILQAMERLGIDMSGIRPSDAVNLWLGEQPIDVGRALLRLFPGHLPERVMVYHPLVKTSQAICLTELVCLIPAFYVAIVFELEGLIVTALATLLFSAVLLAFSERRYAARIQFAEELTFGELASEIAASQRRAGSGLVPNCDLFSKDLSRGMRMSGCLRG